MLVIYHSRDALPARQAAAIHLGWLPSSPPARPADLAGIFEKLGGPAALEGEGLWPLGRDGMGRRVFAFGRASRPDVIHRAFHGLAELFRVEHDAYLLQHVGPGMAWTDMKVRLLRRCGLDRWAARLLVASLRPGWLAASEAVRQAAERLAIHEVTKGPSG